MPLAAVAEPELLPDAIAQELSLQPSGGQSSEDALRAFLVDRSLLLVLDNLEHLLDATPLVTDLLAAAPGLTVLATSRTHLNLYGETEYAVPPLSAHEDAVALFADRAAAVRPDFVVTDAVRARSARGSTGCRWRSSSPRRASGRSRRPRSSRASSGGSNC